MNAESKRYCVVKYDAAGSFIGVVSGMGKNRGTWDCDHSKRAAQRHAAKCRKDDPRNTYRVETTT